VLTALILRRVPLLSGPITIVSLLMFLLFHTSLTVGVVYFIISCVVSTLAL
jgi:hypothetical protein